MSNLARTLAGQLEAYQKAEPRPVDMLLFCPNCSLQHIDEAKPDVCETCGHSDLSHFANDEIPSGRMGCSVLTCPCEMFTAWLNPAHKSHRCANCNHVWRPADAPTKGVFEIKTRGENDMTASPIVAEWSRAGRLLEENTTLQSQVSDMSMIVRRFLRKYPDYDQHQKVWDYLVRNKLQGSILREGKAPTQSSSENNNAENWQNGNEQFNEQSS